MRTIAARAGDRRRGPQLSSTVGRLAGALCDLGRMSNRLTDNARLAMALANREAATFNHEFISSEHILLGLLGSQRGTAARVLGTLQLTVTQLRDAISASASPEMTQRPPMAKRIVEVALVQARDLQHPEVSTGHLLLAILSMPECDAAQRLQHLGHDLFDIRSRTLSLLRSPGA